MSLGAYIHLPYCLTKCPYCDFNSYGVGSSFPEETYTSAIMCEIDSYSEYLSRDSVSTIFFGGGTPSLFSPRSIGRIIEKIGEYADFERDIEISIEINPRTADVEKFKGFREVGINRASVGIQSFSKKKLKFLGRSNSPEEGKETLKDISDAGFKNFNLDLIYGGSGESLEELEHDIRISIGLNVTHISVYCLTIEDGTKFGSMYRKNLLKLPGDDILSEMFELVDTLLTCNGFEHYEISNFCKPGYECKHNLNYWECGSYIGFGAGAHSHVNKENYPLWGKRWANLRDPVKYIEVVRSNKTAREFTEILTREEALTDRLLMGLRLEKGVNIKQMEKSYGAVFLQDKLKNSIRDGLIEVNHENLKITDSGRIFSNELICIAIGSFEFPS